MSLYFYEDIEVGATLHAGPITVDRSEMLGFSQIWDPLPIHLDPAAARPLYKDITAPSCFTICLKQRLIHQLERPLAVIATMAWENLSYPTAIIGGDQVRLRLTWTDKRRSNSKPERGIAKAKIELLNQDNKIVLSYLDVLLIIAASDRN